MNKKISVIMGVYNCEATLAEAIDSILEQSYKNWELIICDDCSTDKTLDVIRKYVKDYPQQVRMLKNDRNMGLNFTLNKCLEAITGDYVARMDGDDISCPTRFEEEVMILNNCPEISIVSTDMFFFDENGVWGKTHVSEKPDKRKFLVETPFCHAACMVRKEAYFDVNGYSVSKKLLRVEDYHLWIKMYEKGYTGVNIQKPLYMMRDDRNAIQRRKFKYRINESYVKAYAIKHLRMPLYTYVYCLKPIIVGLLPKGLYQLLHRKKQSGE